MRPTHPTLENDVKVTREEVIALIDGERVYQERRWGKYHHSAGGYLTYMWRYYRQLEDLEKEPDDTAAHYSGRSAIRKLAALAVACMENRGCVRRDGEARKGATPRAWVYAAIDDERRYQEDKWPHKQPFELSEELTVLRRYLRVADELWTVNTDESLSLDVIRKVAAACVRYMENHVVPPRYDAL